MRLFYDFIMFPGLLFNVSMFFFNHNLEIKGIFPSLILADLNAQFEGACLLCVTSHCCDWLTCLHLK